jgi:alpha,alpha-trehalose phosphorylase
MHVPVDVERGFHPQDTRFLEREVWDVDATPPDKFPLLLH